MDSARLRWAALAGAKAAVRGAPRREAVAPMTTMAPLPFAFIAGITFCEAIRRPWAFTRHAISNCSGAMSSTVAKTPEPAL